MTREICFFLETPLTKRDFERFGFERLQARGFRVTVLDLTPVLYPHFAGQVAAEDLSSYPGVHAASTWDDVRAFLKARDGSFGISLTVFDRTSRPLYEILEDTGFDYAAFCLNHVPTRTGWSLRGIAWSGLSWRRVFHRLRMIASGLRRVQGKGVRPPAFVIRGGVRHIPSYPGRDEDLEALWAHALDYDLFLRTPPPERPDDCSVFIDEFRPYHSDYVLINHRGAVFSLEPGAYYASLRRFFDFVEQRSGWPVVVAAHPRSRYADLPDLFGGRRMEKGRTPELIARSRFVLAHSSTAVNFPVLFRKPVVFMTTDGILATHEAKFADLSAEALGRSPINIDRPEEWSLRDAERVSEPHYARYQTDYIKRPGSPEKPFWDIVADRLSAAGAAP